MQKRYLFICVFFFVISAISAQRQIISLENGWKFKHGKIDEAYRINFDDRNWQIVSVPHDWAIFGPFDDSNDKYSQKIVENMETTPDVLTGRTGALPLIDEGWYRKKFHLPETYHKGQKIILAFDGVMSEPKVYLNGEKVGEWNYGYNYFYFDVTDKIIVDKENLLVVSCSNKEQSSRWYQGAGIFRKVQLIVKNNECVEHWGTFISTPAVNSDWASVNIKTRVTDNHLFITNEIIDPFGKVITTDTAKNCINNEFDQNIKVTKPQLWTPETPYLYSAVTKVFNLRGKTDEIKTTFGIRSISFGADGFKLNGKNTKFKGVCLHHDLGPLGTAVNVAAIKRQLTILKDLGCNAIRSSHNMPSTELLDLCDEMGFMFMAEAFDEWKMPKMKNGYNRFFETDVEKDIVNFVQADRNHPCIVMWSAGNEVPDQNTADGSKIARRLQELFHREDPTRPVTVGINQPDAALNNGFASLLDIPGFNYSVGKFNDAHTKLSQSFMLSTESGSTVSSRGIYKFPVEKRRFFRKVDPLKDADHQCSSYDLGCFVWSNLPDEDFILQDKTLWLLGQFVWTGFDYLGEPAPFERSWPSRSSYFGMVDLAGIPKDRYYLYQSLWNTNDSTLHMLPHWTWPGREGETTPVFVYTNYESAELFINGKSQGIQHKNDSTPQNYHRLMWMNVKYEPGTIKVIALDKTGNPIAEALEKTAGKPYKIILEPDRKQINADGKDISFVTVSVVDKNGVPCPTATNQLNFKVTGQGSFRAACNGDATSLEMFHLPTMKLFSGKLVVLLQSSVTSGEIKLVVNGVGLKAGNVIVQSEKR